MNIKLTKEYVLELNFVEGNEKKTIDIVIPSDEYGYKKLSLVILKFQQKLKEVETFSVDLNIKYVDGLKSLYSSYVVYKTEDIDLYTMVKNEYVSTDNFDPEYTNNKFDLFSILKSDIQELISCETLWKEVLNSSTDDNIESEQFMLC